MKRVSMTTGLMSPKRGGIFTPFGDQRKVVVKMVHESGDISIIYIITIYNIKYLGLRLLSPNPGDRRVTEGDTRSRGISP